MTNLDDNILCSTSFSNLDCDSTTGADLGVEDDIEVLDDLFVGDDATITGALFVSAGGTTFSQFGPTTVAIPGVPSDAKDILASTKLRTTTTGLIRAGIFIAETNSSLAITSGQTHGLNAIAATNSGFTVSSTKTTLAGGFVGGRYATRHGAAGTLAQVGGAAGQAQIIGDKTGIITVGYGFFDEGGDGGDGSGSIVTYKGFWVRDGIGNITNKIGLHVEDLIIGDNTSIGIQLDGAEKYALWFNNDSGTAVDGITFRATDQVTLYASAANTLKTDDTFIAATDLQSLGGFVGDVEIVTATSATLGSDDHIMLIDDDTAGGAVTITLPACASHNGRQYHIKKLGTTANVTIDGNASETIDGGLTAVLTAQYESIGIVCDSSNWSIF